MGFLGQLKRSVAPTVWAALEAVNPAAFWRLKHGKLDHAEERELILAPLLCTPDTIAVDVGAANGVYAIRLCGRAKRVIAFEAQPRLARSLNAIARADLLDIQVETVALSDHSGSIILRVPHNDYGRATVEQTNSLDDLTDIDQIAVRTRRLDDYELDNVGFIKIDVEGHELAVLRGGEQTIRRSAPVLLMELEDRHRRNAVSEATNFLADLGYSGYFITDEGLQSITHFEPSVHQAARNIPKPPYYTEAGHTYFNNFLFCTANREALLRESVSRLS